jgi:L-lactate dehydrogenase complex protein LldG
MEKSGQSEFIFRVKKALGYFPDQRRRFADVYDLQMRAEDRSVLERIKHRSAEERRQLLARLIESGRSINLNVSAHKDKASAAGALAGLVRTKEPEWSRKKSLAAWKHPLIAGLNLPEALAGQNVPVFYTSLGPIDREHLRQQIIDAYIGVTTADFCLADTGTLVMRARAGQPRSVSLLPLIHVAVIELHQIIADLKELYALLKWDPEIRQEGLANCMTFVSGPSKTADIEADMVYGAHGPREVYIYVIQP